MAWVTFTGMANPGNWAYPANSYDNNTGTNAGITLSPEDSYVED
jgi:hypothetical protein